MRFRVCHFNWSDLPIPADILAIPHEDGCTHLYLEVENEGEWQVVDATWDSSLASVLPINECDQKMQVAVACRGRLSLDESSRYAALLSDSATEVSAAKNKAFFKAINAWLEMVRH